MNQRNFQQHQQQPRGGSNSYQQGGAYGSQQPSQQQQPQQRMMVNSLMNQGSGGFGGNAAGGMMPQQGMGNQPMGLQQQMLQQKANFSQLQGGGGLSQQQSLQGNRMMGLQQQTQAMAGGSVNSGVNMAALSRISNLTSMLASSNAGNAMNNMGQNAGFKSNMAAAALNTNSNDTNEWDQFFSQASAGSSNQNQQQSSMRGNFNQSQMQSTFSSNQSFGGSQQSMGMNSLQGQVLPSRNLQSLLQAQQQQQQQQQSSTMYDPISPSMDSHYGPGGRVGGSMQNAMNSAGGALRMMQQSPSGNIGGGGGGSFLPADVRFQNLQQQNDFDDMMSTGSGGGMRSHNPRGFSGRNGGPGPSGAAGGGFHGSGGGAPSRFPKSQSMPGGRTSKPYYFHDLPPLIGPVNPNRKTSKWSRTFEDPLAFPAPFVGIKSTDRSKSVMLSKAPVSAFSSRTSTMPASSARSQYNAIDARAIRKLQSSSAPSSRSTRRKRERSNSPSNERSRSNSPVGDHSRRGSAGAASAPAGSNETSGYRIPKRTLRGNSPPRGGSSAASTSGRSRRLDLSTLSLKELAQTLHLNIISKNVSSLDVMELNLRFPQLYIPADFIETKIDLNELFHAFNQDFFSELGCSIPLMIENNPSTLIYREADGKEEQQLQSQAEASSSTLEGAENHANGHSENANAEAVDGQIVEQNVSHNDDLVTLRRTFHSDIQRTPKFSYLSALTCNNAVLGQAVGDEEEHPYMDKFCYDNKLIKFNVRVLVGCGVKDEEEVFDNNFFRKMRVLCGRKKGVATLLGTSYCQELDGGNPLLDRSCLFNTARRALYAQCLLDIGNDPSSSMVKLAEVCYHRPKEEIGGKEYPEQEEISVLFFYAIQPSFLEAIEDSTFDIQWDIFSRRLQGTLSGPMLSKSVNQNEEDYHMNIQDILALDQKVSEHLAERGSHPTATGAEKTANDGDEKNDDSLAAKDEPAKEGIESSSSFSFRDIAPLEKQKPDTPCVLLAPMPLPIESKTVPIHKQDSLSLRVVPMSNILSYSQDDRNERLFEVSLAAELLQSHIVLAHADMIADFILSDHDDLSYLANARVLQVVKHFREKESKAPKNTSSNAPPTPSKSEGAADTPASTVVMADTETADKPISTEVVQQDAEEKAPEHEEMHHNAEQAESKQAEVEDSDPFGISADEAAMMKKKFIGACRWFDVHQDRYLKQDALLLILYTSHRNITRADAVSISEELCKDDKFFYETFLP